MTDKPVLEMTDREWAVELDRIKRQSFARAVIAREDAETAAYLARHFPAEGTQDPDDKTDERTEQEKQLAASVAVEAEAFLSRQ